MAFKFAIRGDEYYECTDCGRRDVERTGNDEDFPIDRAWLLHQAEDSSPLVRLGIITYTHHGKRMAVLSHLRGKHRDATLCLYDCAKYHPNTPEQCPYAQRIIETCVKFGVVLPVWECAHYVPLYEEEG
jgi:hypothetical protein